MLHGNGASLSESDGAVGVDEGQDDSVLSLQVGETAYAGWTA